jgi:L-asparaginase II
VYRSWIKRDYTPTGVCSNCSGKHVGMLAGARVLGAAIADYHLPEHPMQLRVKQVLADACGLREDEVDWAIDGCNLPTPAFRSTGSRVSTRRSPTARMRSKPAASRPPIACARARIHRAMTAHPSWSPEMAATARC